MTMDEWAEREIELACQREKQDVDNDGLCDYGCWCYKSALKAYKSLMADGHSGMSFSFTKDILIRLMNNLPLAPITEKDFEGVEPFDIDEKEHYVMTQCPRMPRLFQTKYADGTVKYSDVDRVICYQEGSDHAVGYWLFTRLVDKMYPITMPYWPPANDYKVYYKTLRLNSHNRDYDTVEAMYLITPDGERVEINRYWTEKDREMVEIDKEEYDRLKAWVSGIEK